ncbi:hypothetical protein [Chamaesiphon sp. OTE_75_metabat_556]|nr:hypothetical protein [Chamaesiphon sp. OTE_75_metabat_556]
MTIRQPRYTKEEFTQRGDALYDSQIQAIEGGSVPIESLSLAEPRSV